MTTVKNGGNLRYFVSIARRVAVFCPSL